MTMLYDEGQTADYQLTHHSRGEIMISAANPDDLDEISCIRSSVSGSPYGCELTFTGALVPQPVNA